MSDVTSGLVMGCQAVIAVTFATSAGAKLAGRDAYADFRRWLSVSAGVPSRLAAPVAASMVVIEAVAAVAMVIPRAVLTGFVLATLLLVVFTASVHSMIRRRVRVPCRCFGAGRHPPGPAHLARNVILLLAAAGGGGMTLAAGGAPAVDQETALAAIAGAAAALLLINLEEIVALARPAVPGVRRRSGEETP